MPKKGFKGQWVPISQLGKFNDSTSIERNLDENFFNQAIANFTPNDAPAVIGHPKDNNPAFGWASALRLKDGVLEAQFADTDDKFEQMVEEGKFRKRSASFYMNPPKLRHVGFLGAQPPAIKGLRDIQFNDGDDVVTVEISFKEQTMNTENNNTQEKKTFGEWWKETFGGGQSAPASTANFSEVDQQKLIETVVKQATEATEAKFTEELKKRDTQILELTNSVNSNSASGRRAEITSFVEGIPATKGKHFLVNIGIAEFLEECAKVDAANSNAEFTAFSEGEGDKKVEHKFTLLGYAKNLISSLPAMMEFGEKFGEIKVTAEITEMMDPERANQINAVLNLGDKGGDE